MEKSDILSLFNQQLDAFFDDIIMVFPKENDLKLAYVSLMAIRTANPKLIIKIWNYHISERYGNEIEKGNMDFFINKDYNEDLKKTSNASIIISKIGMFREPIRKLGRDNLDKTSQYLQNLTKISKLYFE